MQHKKVELLLQKLKKILKHRRARHILNSSFSNKWQLAILGSDSYIWPTYIQLTLSITHYSDSKTYINLTQACQKEKCQLPPIQLYSYQRILLVRKEALIFPVRL